MGFWKGGDDDEPTTPGTSSVPLRIDELLPLFGKTAADVLKQHVPSVHAVREGPFLRAEIVGHPRPFPQAWLVDEAGAPVLWGRAHALAAALSQSLIEPMPIDERVRRAARFSGARVLEQASDLDDALSGGMTTPDDDALRRRYEPPHGEGACFVFFVCDDARVVRGGDVYRCVVDVESLHSTFERVGALPRPLLLRGRAHVDDAGAWVVAPASSSPASSSPSPAASPWIEQAQTEHASIAAFARLTLELMAVGAPLSLLSRVQEAALDEVRHAQQCLALARRDGFDATLGPLPALPPRPGDRFALAQRTWDEAVVPESDAIVQMRDQLTHVDDEARAVLAQQITDEERHVQLARDIVAWARAS